MNVRKKERLEVLMSAMHQKDGSIINRTNISTNVLLINQCDKEERSETHGENGLQRVICTTQRGLSRSRNMALKNAKGEICLICDDDEVLDNDYCDKILEAFDKNADCDVLCFKLNLNGKKFPAYGYTVNYINSLKISSWQIAFRRESIVNKGLAFDERFGSGTPIGSGEENIFLYDCLRNKLKIKYVPICIGTVAQEESQWFKGFNEEYFLNRGIIIKRLMGVPFGVFYCLYFIVFKAKDYRQTTTIHRATINIMKGLWGKL